MNQSWISALTAILDTTAMPIAGVKGLEARQAQLTFAMARHAVVDLAQVFSLTPLNHRPDRLPQESSMRRSTIRSARAASAFAAMGARMSGFGI